MMTRRAIFGGFVLLAACHSSPQPTPAVAPPARATFDLDIPESGQPLRGPSPFGTSVRPPCLHATRFSGVVIPGENDARILLSPAYVNVDRHNDKKFDALTLRLEVAEPRHALGAGNPVDYRFRPTVDTAGPSITTWQSQDTIRLLVPWNKRLGARWLLFFLDYSAVSYTGESSGCSAILKSDTLRFGGY